MVIQAILGGNTQSWPGCDKLSRQGSEVTFVRQLQPDVISRLLCRVNVPWLRPGGCWSTNGLNVVRSLSALLWMRPLFEKLQPVNFVAIH